MNFEDARTSRRRQATSRPARLGGLTAILVIPLLLATAGCAAQESTDEGIELVSVAVVPGIVDPLMPQIGAHFGIFAEHGIELEFIEVKDGPAMVSAIVSSAADIAEAGPIVSFPAYERGGGITWLMNNYDIDYTLIAAPNLDLPSIGEPYPAGVADMEGLRIGVAARGGQSERFVSRALADAGLSDSDVTYVAVGTGVSAVAAFQNDQVDAIVSFPPTEFLLEDGSYQTVIDLETTKNEVFGPEYIFTAQAANTDFVEKRPKVVQGYCDAFRESIDFAKDPENLADVVDFVSEELNLDKQKATLLWEAYAGNFSAELTEDRWNGLDQFDLGVPTPAWDEAVHEGCALGTGS